MNEIEIGEKLSALHDGELESSVIDELIDLVSKDTQLQKKLSFYSVMGMAANYESNKVVKIKTKKTKNIFSNLWLSNAMTAAASILLTLIFVNDNDFSRMNVDSKSFDQITSAINSKEAKNIAKQSEEYLTDHKSGHGEYVKGVWVSVKSMPGRAFYFETYLPEYAAMYLSLIHI